MEDLEERIEKLETDAADCDLIAKLAADAVKRETFGHLARQLRQMASDLRAVMQARAGQDAA